MKQLNDNHQEQIVNYLRFSRLNRAQFLKDVQLTFSDIRNQRLKESNYTKEEVFQLTQHLENLIKSEIERELVGLSHSNVLLLQQYFTLAESWNLKLVSNIGQLDNKILKEAVAEFEEAQFSLKPKETVTSTVPKLVPLMDAGGVALLQAEIDRLRGENQALKNSLSMQTVSQQGASQLEEAEVEALKAKLSVLESDLNAKLQNSKPVQQLRKLLSKKNDDLRLLRQQLSKLDPSFVAEPTKDEEVNAAE